MLTYHELLKPPYVNLAPSEYSDVITMLRVFDAGLMPSLIPSLGEITFRFLQTLQPQDVGYLGVRHIFGDTTVVVIRQIKDDQLDTHEIKIFDKEEPLGNLVDLPLFSDLERPAPIKISDPVPASAPVHSDVDFPM